MKHVFLAGCLILFGSTVAQAETFNRAVKRNVITIIGGFYGYNRMDCGDTGIPNVRITEQAQHGILTVRSATGVVPAGKDCAGTTMHLVQYVYTPAPNYTGSDEVTVSVPFLTDPWRGRAETNYDYTYRISVQ